jgi:serine/threonine-protein kinase RsbW
MGKPGVLETVTGWAALDEICTMLERMWSAHDHVPVPVRTQVGIAVGEIGANIIEHASRGTPVRLRFEVLVLPDEVRVFFTDHGSPARIDLTSAAMPDQMAESGRGLALANAVLHRLDYIRGWANHWLLISKRFA